MDAREEKIMPILAQAYGYGHAAKWRV